MKAVSLSSQHHLSGTRKPRALDRLAERRRQDRDAQVDRSPLEDDADAAVLGLSATPERLDGKGLDTLFDDMIAVETVPKLIARGFLVQPTGYEGPKPDLTGGGDDGDVEHGARRGAGHRRPRRAGRRR